MPGTDKRDTITVVIPNYNGIQYIRGCLDSLLEGTFLPEIIVVDNASDDGSSELIEREYPGIRLLKLKANTGFCHAVNCGLHLVRTPYAILLNNDTRVDQACVEQLYIRIVQNGNAFSAQAKMLSMKDPEVIDDAGDLYCLLGWAFARGKAMNRDRFCRDDEIFSSCAGAAIYRMKVFDEIGWFDERHFCYLEDVDIGYRAKIYGYVNLFASGAVVWHAGSASSGAVHNPFKEAMTSGNNAYLLYKNQPAFFYGLNAPWRKLGQAVKKRYFHRKGLGESYDAGLERGRILKELAKDHDWMVRNDIPCRKGTIAQEACLSDPDEEQDRVLPVYLGEKVPFCFSHLGNYLHIEGELISNTFRRIFQ